MSKSIKITKRDLEFAVRDYLKSKNIEVGENVELMFLNQEKVERTDYDEIKVSWK